MAQLTEQVVLELLDAAHRGAYDLYFENDEELSELIARWEIILEDNGYE